MIKKASILNVYLAILPYAASLTLIKDGFGNNFPLSVSDYTGYAISIFTIMLSYVILFSRSFYIDIFIQNIKDNLSYVILLLIISITFTIKIVLGVGSTDFEVFARILSYLMVGFTTFLLLPIFVYKKEGFNVFVTSIFTIGLATSLIAILGIMEISPFSGWIIRDEKMGWIGLNSTSSIFFEPNVFAVLCLISFGIGYYLLSQTNKYILKAILLISLIIILLGIFFTWSRTAWGLVLGFVIMYYLARLSIKKLFIVLFPIVITAFLIIYFYVISNDDLLLALVWDDLLTGRLDLWSAGWFYIQQSPLIGHGVGHSDLNNLLLTFGHDHLTTHQVFIDYALMHGLMPALLYFFIFIKSIIRAKFKSNMCFYRKNFLVAILVSLFLFIQFSPHNLGGSSLIAVVMTIFFGLANLRSGNAGRF